MSRGRARRWFPRARTVWAGLILAPLLILLALRFIPPPTSAFMLASEVRPVNYRWVARENISSWAALAVVAAEDQKFPSHRGFDIDSMRDAFQHNARSRHLRGASTISQQTAKNLFLWSGHSYLRKGLEAGITALLELLWPKRRILEVYLNVAQFGPGIYGVQAASQRYFGKPASGLTAQQAALLAAVLPNPVQLKVSRPSAYVRARASYIETQMRQLGPDYLKSSW